MKMGNFKLRFISSVLCLTLLSATSSIAFADVEEVHETMASKVAHIKSEQENPIGFVQLANVIPGHVYIPKGTTFEVELVDAASSKTNKTGQNIEVRMVDNLIINDVVVIQKDTIGDALVAEARSAGGFGRKGKLTISPQVIKTVNGIKVPLKADLIGSGNSDGGAVAVAAVISLVGGIFMKGTNINYPAGTKIKVAVEKDTDLNVIPENLSNEMDLSKPQGNKLVLTVK